MARLPSPALCPAWRPSQGSRNRRDVPPAQHKALLWVIGIYAGFAYAITEITKVW